MLFEDALEAVRYAHGVQLHNDVCIYAVGAKYLVDRVGLKQRVLTVFRCINAEL